MFVLLSAISVHAVTHLTDCADLNSASESYVLDNDVSFTGSTYCFTFSAIDITLDCQGHKITGDETWDGYAFMDNCAGGIRTLRNCDISNVGVGLENTCSDGGTVIMDNVTIYDVNSKAFNTYGEAVQISNSRFYNGTWLYIDGTSSTTCKNSFFDNVIGDYDLPLVFYNDTANIQNQEFSFLQLCDVHDSYLNNITVREVPFKGIDPFGLEGSDIYLTGLSNVTINNSKFEHIGAIFIYPTDDVSPISDVRILNTNLTEPDYAAPIYFTVTDCNLIQLENVYADDLPVILVNTTSSLSGNYYFIQLCAGSAGTSITNANIKNLFYSNNINDVYISNLTMSQRDYGYNPYKVNVRTGSNFTMVNSTIFGGWYPVYVFSVNGFNIINDSITNVPYPFSSPSLNHPIYLRTSSNGNIYSNFFNTSYDSDYIYSRSSSSISLDNGSIGNFYTNYNGNGYSNTCSDLDEDGICDTPLVIHQFVSGSDLVDSYPLAAPAPPCSEGTYKCVGSERQVCSSGNWTLYENCTYGCDEDACIPAPTDWLAGYGKRVRLNLTITPLYDYEIDFNITYLDGMKSNFSDLQFTDSGSVPLKEYLSSKLDGTYANFTAKVHANATYVYLYFNSTATPLMSNKTRVFTLWDDEETSTNGWANDYGDPLLSISSDYAHSGSNSMKFIDNYGNTHIGRSSTVGDACGILVDYWTLYTDNLTEYYSGIGNSTYLTSASVFMQTYGTGDIWWLSTSPYGWMDTGNPLSNGTWYHNQFWVNESCYINKVDFGDGLAYHEYSDYSVSIGNIGAYLVAKDGKTIYIDDVTYRRYQQDEPSYVIGSVENLSTCSEGDHRCNGLDREVCSSGSWIFDETCQYGCSSGNCSLPVMLSACSGTHWSTSNTTYLFTNDAVLPVGLNFCIHIQSGTSNIVIDCQGHILDGNNSYAEGVRVDYGSNVIVKNCTLVHFANRGIMLNYVGYGSVHDSTFIEDGYANYFSGGGLVLSDSDYFNIYNNKFENDSTGINLGNGAVQMMHNDFYNNLFNETTPFTIGFSLITPYWGMNTTMQNGTRIYGLGPYIGGNYYTNSTNDGFSDTCADADMNGFCDSTITFCQGPFMCGTDYLPLSNEYPAPPAPPAPTGGQIIADIGSGLGGLFTLIVHPLAFILLVLGIIVGVLVIFYGIASVFSRLHS